VEVAAVNAITAITIPIEDSPHRRAISIHCPNCPEFEMASRVHLATLRDQAGKGMHRASSESAYVLLLEVARTAAVAVYAKRPIGELMMLVSALKLTMEAARALERVAR
jgi:hypothetical protein